MTKTKARSRRQFSILSILGLMLVAALSIVGWQKYIYVHPAHKNTMYEKAPFTNSGQFKLGKNVVSIKSITHSDRGNRIVAEDRMGKPLASPPAYAEMLKSSADWLDTVQLELDAGDSEFEVIHARIFDYSTRTAIGKTDPQTGYRMIDPSTLQIYRLGAKLPDRLDVWLRVRSYPKKNGEIVKLNPAVNRPAKGLGGSFEIVEFCDGFASYSTATGQLVGDPQSADRESAYLVKFDGNWPKGQRVQIVTVGKNGDRRHEAQYFTFTDYYSDHPKLLTLPMGREQIDHIEIREFVDRRVFFFQGLKVPTTSQSAFVRPPHVEIPAGSLAEELSITEFLPLDVSVAMESGSTATGTFSSEHAQDIMRNINNTKMDSHATFITRTMGLGGRCLSVNVAATDPEKGAIVPLRRGSGSSGGSASHLKYQVLQVPIEQVDSIQLRLPDPIASPVKFSGQP